MSLFLRFQSSSRALRRLEDLECFAAQLANEVALRRLSGCHVNRQVVRLDGKVSLRLSRSSCGRRALADSMA